jgi:hypothetical protein
VSKQAHTMIKGTHCNSLAVASAAASSFAFLALVFLWKEVSESNGGMG